MENEGKTPRTIHLPDELLGAIVKQNKSQNTLRKSEGKMKINSSEEIIKLISFALKEIEKEPQKSY
jgi:hypothetical protein